MKKFFLLVAALLALSGCCYHEEGGYTWDPWEEPLLRADHVHKPGCGHRYFDGHFFVEPPGP
jgi:hypothetical protein